jgi:hypothetical protein
VRASTTFATGGNVTSVRVDDPELPAEAGRCVEERLRVATVPAFAGRDTTMRATWFVR